MVFSRTILNPLARLLLACWFWAAVAATLGTIFAFWGDNHWVLDLLNHFRLVYLCILIPALIIVLYERPQRWMAVVFMTAIALNLWQILPMYDSGNIAHHQQAKEQAIARHMPKIKILQINVYAGNTDYKPIYETIDRYDPDVLILEEFMTHHAVAMKQSGNLDRFKYSMRDLNTLNAVYSRYPFLGNMAFGAPFDTNAIIVMRLAVPQDEHNPKSRVYPLNIITVHPERPSRGERAAWRQKIYFDQVLKITKKRMKNEAVLVAGDFNTTPWASPFRTLTKNTGFVPAYMGLGPQPTYPRYLWRGKIPWFFPLLPIDHVLINNNLAVLDRKTLPEVHSDHLPTYTEVILTSPDKVAAVSK